MILAKIRDDTWNELNMQQIWKDEIIETSLVVELLRLKNLSTWLNPNPHLYCQQKGQPLLL